MNGDLAFIKTHCELLNKSCSGSSTEVVVGVPACYLMTVRSQLDKSIGVAAQNCYKAAKGAFTGKTQIYVTY